MHMHTCHMLNTQGMLLTHIYTLLTMALPLTKSGPQSCCSASLVSILHGPVLHMHARASIHTVERVRATTQ